MTDPARRALLGAFIVAPAAALPAHAFAEAAPLDALRRAADAGGDDLLERAARFDADRAFASLCADLLSARRVEIEAFQRFHAANEEADATAAFPTGLQWRARYQPLDGDVQEWIEHWAPEKDRGGMRLWNLAHRRLQTTGETVRQAEAALRAEYDTWMRAFADAKGALGVDELHAAANAAGDAERAAYAAVKAYCPRSAETLLTKLLLLDADGDWPREPREFQAIIADVCGALAS